MSLCISRKMPLLEPRTSLDVLLPSPLLTQVGIPKKLEVFSNYLSKKKKKKLEVFSLGTCFLHTEPYTTFYRQEVYWRVGKERRS
jgi:hypothetical protein